MNDIYRAAVTAKDLTYWGFGVKKYHGNRFTAEYAREILEFADKKYSELFGKEVKFNKVKLVMDNGKVGVYWKEENVLRIIVDGIPVYENNNGTICRDSVAIMDSMHL